MTEYIGIVYAHRTGAIRRMMRTDQLASLQAFSAQIHNRERFIEIPAVEYLAMSSAADLDAWLTAAAPNSNSWEHHHGRCVEIDSEGAIVAVLAADSEIDAPVRGPLNRVEEREDGEVGDIIVGEGLERSRRVPDFEPQAA